MSDNPLALIVMFFAIYIILVDIGMSIIGMLVTRTPNALLCSYCHRCGAEIGHEIWSVSIWKLITHRCDDNLAGP